MRYFFLFLILNAFTMGCQHTSKNAQTTKCKADASKIGFAKMPGLPKVDEIGYAIQKEYKLYYTSGGLHCNGQQAYYQFYFKTQNQLNLSEIRAVSLMLLEKIMKSLSKEPGIQERLQNNPNFEACLRNSLDIELIQEKKDTLVKRTDHLGYVCHFLHDKFAYVTMKSKEKGGIDCQVVKTEPYNEAKELFMQNPKTPQLSFCGEATVVM